VSTQRDTSTTTPSRSQLIAALDDDERPAPAGVLRACSTFAWRGLLKIRHVPEQLVDATIGPVLLLTMFTYLFGGAIEGSTGEYLQFVLPGALVMAVVLTTTHSGIALYADRTRGVVDRFRSMPVWAPAPLVGAVAGDAVRYALAVTTVLLAGLLLGFDAAGGVPGVLAGALLVVVFAFALSWIFTAGGLALRSQSAVQSAALIGVLVPVLVSNVFVEPSTLPAVLQGVVDMNPISHLTTAVRGLLSGDPAAKDILLVLAEATVITAIFAPLTWRQYRRG
jgi:ABC-2 type transport system permease protein